MQQFPHPGGTWFKRWDRITSCPKGGYSRGGAEVANSVPNKLRWSKGFSSGLFRRCGYPGGQVTSTSRAKNISLVQWFLIRLGSMLQLSRSPGEKHF